MDFKLKKKPKNVTIIEGFPGFGLVSSIAIEFLLDHLKAEEIGDFEYSEFPPTLAIHKGKIVKPMSIWHVKKHNLILIHSTYNIEGVEWDMADAILKMAKQLEAKEIITLEGLASAEKETKAYTHDNKKLQELGAQPLNESILMGVTAALMLKSDKVTPLFAGAHTRLPDGQAAAKLVEVLSDYLKLGVDSEPLLKKAAEFEDKLKNIINQAQQVQEDTEKKKLSYLG